MHFVDKIFSHRGAKCKTSNSRKIDDFCVECRCCDETIPERLGEEQQRYSTQKARFFEGSKFCIWLQEENNFFMVIRPWLGAFFLSALVLLLPAINKFIFSAPRHAIPPGTSEPIWGRFIFAHLLFLVQVFFFFLHPACRSLPKLARYAIGFLLLFLLGCLLSPWLTGSYRQFQELVKMFSVSSLLFLLLYFSHKGSSRTILRACTYIGCLLMAGEALLGLAQYILQGDLGLRWLGEKHLAPSGPFASLHLANSVRWTFDSGTNMADVLRPYGTFDHPNHFGGLLMVGILLNCHILASYAQSAFSKFFFTLTLTLQALALTATFSRSAWLGIAIGVLIFLGCRLLRGVNLWNSDRALLIALAFSASVTFGFFHDQIFQRCSANSACGDIMPRTQYWKDLDLGKRGEFMGIAQSMVAHHPWRGVGFQEFVRQLPNYVASPEQRLPVHNIYLLSAAELGLPAAAVLIVFIILTACRGLRKACPEALLALWISLAFIGFMDNYLLTSQAGRFLLFITAALLLLNHREERETLNAKC